MYTFLSILIVLLSILLIFIVTIQESKGGGLAAGFASNNQFMGVRKTTDFLEKATWTLIGAIVVLCIISTRYAPKYSSDGQRSSDVEEMVNQAPMPKINGEERPFAVPAEETPAAPATPAPEKK